ncbi:hypothetical protein Gpo141_00001955 [Globisporangium polare]
MTDTSKLQRGAWSEEEHQRFLAAMQQFPKGPWKAIAESIGSRSVRQVQTHAQQHHEKSARKVFGLRRDRKRALVAHQQQHEQVDPLVQSSSELVSLWRKLEAQGETDGVLATSARASRLGRSTSDEDLAVLVEQ